MSMFIEVMQMPGTRKSIEVANGTTIGQACEQAGFSPSGYTVGVSNDASATLDSVVRDNARIILTRQVKGA